MKVLLSGGTKTGNIVTSIEKKFKSSGDEFIVVDFLDDINEIFLRGDSYDKAIITEQSITREFSIKDEHVIRGRISSFVNDCLNRSGKFSYVFLTQNEQLAEMIHEEILPIMSCSSVVLYLKQYTVSFFTTLIRSDVKQLPKDIVFVPKPIEDDFGAIGNVEVEDVGISEDELGVSDYNPYMVDSESDLVGQIFHNDVTGVSDDVRVTGLDIDDGDGILVDIDDEERSAIGDYGDNTTYMEEPMTNNDMGYTEQPMNDTSFGGGMQDEYIDDKVYAEDDMIKQSGVLPTVGAPVATNEFSGVDMGSNNIDNSNAESYIGDGDLGMMGDQPLEGFDYDENSDNGYSGNEAYDYGNEGLYNTAPSTDYGFDADMYGSSDTTGNTSSMNEDSGGMNTTDIGLVGVGGIGFGEELYNNQTVGFDEGDYGVEADTSKDYDNSIAENVYSSDEPFNASDYANNGQGMNQGNEDMMQSNMQPQQAGRKKGLLGGLFGRKHNNEHVQTVQEQIPIQESTSKPNTSGSTVRKVTELLKPFAARGNSIMVTGCGGCGTSTVAMNLANMISQLGYTVLLVDFDMENKAQSYISKLQYDAMEPEGANLMSAVNSTVGVTGHVVVVKKGFYLLTMGMASDSMQIEDAIHKEKLSRFANVVKSSYNFIIYDARFKHVTGFLSELTYLSDNIVMVTDASNWGVTKMMLAMCNIDSEDVQMTLFGKAQILFNKYRNTNRILGNKVRTGADITRVMDKKVMELMGEVQDCTFEDMHIAGIIQDDAKFEDGWFEKVQYSDTAKGQEIFLEVLERIVLKK